MGRVQARSVVRRAQSAEETGYQSAPSSADTRVRRVTSGDNDTLIWSNMCQQGQRALTCYTMVRDDVSVRCAVIIKTTTINHVWRKNVASSFMWPMNVWSCIPAIWGGRTAVTSDSPGRVAGTGSSCCWYKAALASWPSSHSGWSQTGAVCSPVTGCYHLNVIFSGLPNQWLLSLSELSDGLCDTFTYSNLIRFERCVRSKNWVARVSSDSDNKY